MTMAQQMTQFKPTFKRISGGKDDEKLVAILLLLAVMCSFCACGNNSTPAAEASSEVSEAPAAAETPSEEALIDDESWDQLESMGKIETENGLLFVSITLPADFVGTDISQESIDAEAGDTYTSGKLNEDGSVTYKMTKKQHKAMLESTAENIDKALQELVDNQEYIFTEIKHNDQFSVFDITLSTDDVGINESLMVLGFYLYGGMYTTFSGLEADNITVNFYSPSGDLISTANSADMAE